MDAAEDVHDPVALSGGYARLNLFARREEGRTEGTDANVLLARYCLAAPGVLSGASPTSFAPAQENREAAEQDKDGHEQGGSEDRGGQRHHPLLLYFNYRRDC
jgi:hypothetical protein